MGKFKRIVLKAKKQVFSGMVGNNSSMFLGEGYDFSELREYQIGDDIRHIDWIVSAKVQKPFVKLFKSQKELNVAIVVVLSRGLLFGTQKSKQDLVLEVASLIGFSAIKNGDKLTAFLVSDKLHNIPRPTKSITAVNKIMEEIYNHNLIDKNPNFENIQKIVFDLLKQKSLIFVISDFIGDIDLKLLSKKHEVLALVIRDNFEENPIPLGFLEIPVLNSNIEIDFNEKIAKEYKDKIYLNDKKLFEQFKKHTIRFTKIYTHEEPFVNLRKLNN